MIKLTVVLSFVISACCASPSPPQESLTKATVITTSLDDCNTGPDDTAMIQAAMLAGTCLPSGVYHVDTPPLGIGGRRRNSDLVHGTLCGVRSDTRIVFRGDTQQQFWAGVQDAHIHNVTLDSTCIPPNTIEQTHLVFLTTSNHNIHDVTFIHPKRASTAGDCIKMAGPLNAPLSDIVIDNSRFESCARYGVQMSSGITGYRVTNSVFGPGVSYGSEGSGGISFGLLSHLTFEADVGRRVVLNVQQQTDLMIDHVTAVNGTALLWCDRCTLAHSSFSGVVAPVSDDFVSPVTISQAAHGVLLTDVHLSVTSVGAAPAITIGPIRTNRQADFSDITIDSSDLVQTTNAPGIAAQGITGFTVTNTSFVGLPTNTAIVFGPSIATAPATSTPTTGVVIVNNVVTGFAQ